MGERVHKLKLRVLQFHAEELLQKPHLGDTQPAGLIDDLITLLEEKERNLYQLKESTDRVFERHFANIPFETMLD